MNCREARPLLAGYVDGAMRVREHTHVSMHLEGCAECRDELEKYHRLAMCLANVGAATPPADLATRIRVEASKTRTLGGELWRLWSRAAVAFENVLRPVAIPATGGVLTALAAFALVVQNILVGVPMGGVAPNDLPLNLVQPARLEKLAPFPMPGMLDATGQVDPNGLFLEATLNAQGQVVSYKILAGPNDSAVQRQLDQLMLFSRFRPLVNFGRPTDGGRVLLNFSEVRVRG